MHIPVITIDGPSGSGKGTISQALAERLGWRFLDSGLIYRVLAWGILEARPELLELGPEAFDSEALAFFEDLAKNLPVYFEGEKTLYGPQNKPQKQDITGLVRTEAISKMASVVSVYPGVRAALLQRQRDFRQSPGLVADGRDMGTIVFPDADFKVFLDASSQERAKRRYLQLKQAGFDANLETILKDIEARDLRDTTRVVAPLKPAEDALLIQTDNRDIPTVLGLVWDGVLERKLN
ncbi:MAG: (d)CMP kinase [Gammaproteobacteria bacterium]